MTCYRGEHSQDETQPQQQLCDILSQVEIKKHVTSSKKIPEGFFFLFWFP
jgi:hypothetical protein